MDKIVKIILIILTLCILTGVCFRKKENFAKNKLSKKKCKNLGREFKKNKCSKICKKGDEIFYKNKCVPVDKMKIVKMDEIQLDKNKFHGFVGGKNIYRKYFYEYEYKNEIVYLKFFKINGTKFKQIGNDIIINDVVFFTFPNYDPFDDNTFLIYFGFELKKNNLFIWKRDKNNNNYYLNCYKLKNNKWIKQINNFKILNNQYLESEDKLFQNYFNKLSTWFNFSPPAKFNTMFTLHYQIFKDEEHNVTVTNNEIAFGGILSKILNSGEIINFTCRGKTKSFKYKNEKLVELEIPINKNYRSLMSWLFKNGKILVLYVIEYDKLYDVNEENKEKVKPIYYSFLIYKLDNKNNKWTFIDKKLTYRMIDIWPTNFNFFDVFMKNSYLIFYLNPAVPPLGDFVFKDESNKMLSSTTKIFKIKEDKLLEINNYKKFKSFILNYTIKSKFLLFYGTEEFPNPEFNYRFIGNGLFYKKFLLKGLDPQMDSYGKINLNINFYKINKYKLEFIDNIIFEMNYFEEKNNMFYSDVRVIKNKIYIYDDRSKKLFYYKLKRCKKGQKKCKNIIPDKCKSKIERNPDCPIDFPYKLKDKCYNKKFCVRNYDCVFTDPEKIMECVHYDEYKKKR